MEAIVEYNYVAQEDDELTLKKGDIITLIPVMIGGWWEGTLRDKRGMFPDNFVKLLDSATASGGSCSNETVQTVNSMKSDEVTLRNGSGRYFCKILYSYEPCNEDEIALVPQDSIEFLGEVEEGWWRGRFRGRVGVFPSNFVSSPVPEEQDRHKERDKKEMCRVLFPYEAANEDELTLVEGDMVMLLSRDAPDKGWWKGELKGQVGLFPDNFVEVIGMKNEAREQETQRHEVTSSIRHSHQAKKSEKAHVRKSLDTRNVHSSNISDHFPTIDTVKKNVSTSSSTSASTLSTLTATGSGGGDKKAAVSHTIISNLKHLVSDAGNNNGIGNMTTAASECREELDGVERGEGAPLSHLTASRAKAPRRRPPSSQHLRHHAAGTARTNASSTLPTVPSALSEDNLSNGRTDTTLEQIPDEETDGLAAKARRKAPWVEELKINQMERRKIATVVDKPEVKKERNIFREMTRVRTQGNTTDSINKPDTDNDDGKQKDKSPKADTSPQAEHNPSASSGQPAYVPYALYSKLLERVVALEEKQAVLQVTIEQLSEQLVPLPANSSVNNKV